jgi:putative transposase
MPWGLKRCHESKETHFITFSCFRRQPLLSHSRKHTFEETLERMRKLYRFRVYGHVLMPEHIHLLLSEPERGTLAIVIQILKQAVSRRCPNAPKPLWETRYYDHNVRTYESFIGKLKYIHRNPVKRGLCKLPEDRRWSSFRHYATGEISVVEIESDWTARRREKELNPAEKPHPSKGG